MIKVIKKDGTKEEFNVQKVIVAVNKSAYRALVKFTDEEIDFICKFVTEKVEQMRKKEVTISDMHNVVESALEQTNPLVAKSYRDYRNYKQDFVQMLDEVYKKSQSIMYIGDKENSNTDSALVSTKRSLIFNELNKELYQKFFMTTEEIQACRDGYIYIHDMSARRDTMNCCLFNVQEVLKGGFEMGNLWYNEPKTLDVAFDVIGDIVLSAASQQYGGFTVPNIELILEPYAEKSYAAGIERYEELGLSRERAEEEAMKDVKREFEQGFQGLLLVLIILLILRRRKFRQAMARIDQAEDREAISLRYGYARCLLHHSSATAPDGAETAAKLNELALFSEQPMTREQRREMDGFAAAALQACKEKWTLSQKLRYKLWDCLY